MNQLQNVEKIIRVEINSHLSRKMIAQTYAYGLQSEYPANWEAIDSMIIKTWSPVALEKIKELAKSGECFK